MSADVAELGPAQVTVRFSSGLQIELAAASMKLEVAVVEDWLDRITELYGVAIGRSITATFDVQEFEVVEEPKTPTPEVEQELAAIRMIRF